MYCRILSGVLYTVWCTMHNIFCCAMYCLVHYVEYCLVSYIYTVWCTMHNIFCCAMYCLVHYVLSGALWIVRCTTVLHAQYFLLCFVLSGALRIVWITMYPIVSLWQYSDADSASALLERKWSGAGIPRYYVHELVCDTTRKSEKREIIREVSCTYPCSISESPLHVISFPTVRWI